MTGWKWFDELSDANAKRLGWMLILLSGLIQVAIIVAIFG